MSSGRATVTLHLQGNSQMTTTQAEDNYYNELESYLRTLAKELKCSDACAGDVWYLRQRSRWTQELENRLIELYNAGTPPNIMEFGHEDN